MEWVVVLHCGHQTQQNANAFFVGVGMDGWMDGWMGWWFLGCCKNLAGLLSIIILIQKSQNREKRRRRRRRRRGY
jgi:hypothetical protein